jgi:hypothetical protein
MKRSVYYREASYICTRLYLSLVNNTQSTLEPPIKWSKILKVEPFNMFQRRCRISLVDSSRIGCSTPIDRYSTHISLRILEKNISLPSNLLEAALNVGPTSRSVEAPLTHNFASRCCASPLRVLND